MILVGFLQEAENNIHCNILNGRNMTSNVSLSLFCEKNREIQILKQDPLKRKKMEIIDKEKNKNRIS